MKFEDLDLLSIGHTVQLAGVIYVGNRTSYFCYLPNEEPEINWPAETLEMDVDQWSTFLRQTDLVEVEILAKASDGKVAKAIVRKSARIVNNDVTWACFRRDNFTCRYCGRADCAMTADHLVLFTEGGPWTKENIVTACKKCNKKRGDTPYAEWLEAGYYKDVSSGQQGRPGIKPEVHEANVALIATLDAIPRMMNIPTRSR